MNLLAILMLLGIFLVSFALGWIAHSLMFGPEIEGDL